MTYKCSVCGISNKHISLHKFPRKDGQLLETWKHNCGLQQDEDATEKRVCRNHFDPQCFSRVNLKRGAIPSLYLHVENPITEFKLLKPKREINSRKCCICMFDNRENPSQRCFFSFPSDESTRDKWKEICSVEDTKYKYVCQIHFPLEEIKGNKLIPSAVPTLVLNTKTPIIFLEVVNIGTVMFPHNIVISQLSN